MKRSCSLIVLLTMFGIVWVQTASADMARYVVKNNPGAAAPYDSPARAAGDIQTAINYAEDGETILVAAGTYDTGGTNVSGTFLTNRVYINKAITVRSVNNDPATTIIKGAWASNGQTNGPDAVRCVYMIKYASLIGFTLTSGATMSANEGAADDRIGGGVFSQSATVTISNCVIAGCSAFGDRVNWYGVGGGGACYGTFYNCTLKDNSTPYKGGGAANAVLFNCTLAGNSADTGGGLYDGKLYGCVVSKNSAVNNGGGARGGMLYGCVVSNNSAGTDGGGVSGGALHDSTLVGNVARNGGGAAGAALSNCTVAFNIAANAGGGVQGGAVYNSTIISNTAANGCGAQEANVFNSTISHNISTQGNSIGGGFLGGVGSNCVISYNRALSGGGAAHGTFYNCLFYGNYATWGGGAVCGNFYLAHCTLVGNKADAYGGGVYAGSSRINDSIVYFNASPNGTNWYIGKDGSLTFTNSCAWPEISGWSANNTTNDPLFIANGSGHGTNHVPGNYRLQANSPMQEMGIRN